MQMLWPMLLINLPMPCSPPGASHETSLPPRYMVRHRITGWRGGVRNLAARESGMSEKRYYYDCPLKAAFMAKYHGMKFTTFPNDRIVREGTFTAYLRPDDYKDAAFWDANGGKIYI